MVKYIADVLYQKKTDVFQNWAVTIDTISKLEQIMKIMKSYIHFNIQNIKCIR